MIEVRTAGMWSEDHGGRHRPSRGRLSAAAALPLVVLLTSLLVGVLPAPDARAAGGADLAVQLAVVDDLADPQVFSATLVNHGPDDAHDPVLVVDAGGQRLVDHDADPQPGTRRDGVGCALEHDLLECGFDLVRVGQPVTVTLEIAVEADATLSARAESAGTPDPNPTANGSDALLLTPAAADLAVEAVVRADGPDRAAVEVRVVHDGGRTTDATLRVTGPVEAAPEGCEPVEDGWSCALPRLEAARQRSGALRVVRPEPGEPAVEVVLEVRPDGLADPDPADDVATAVVHPRDAVPADVRRHQGAERTRTAIAVARALHPEGARAVILARADDHADALAGAPLAVRVGGPILLTGSAQLADVTAAELDRLLPPGATVHLLGGEAALGPAVEDAVRAAGFRTTRHAGPNRYATSAAVHRALGPVAEVAVADGDGFADAVVAAAAMAGRGGALLLTSGSRLPDEVAAQARDASWAVGTGAARAVPWAADLAATTPAETSVVVAEALAPDATAVGVATVAAFPDALAGGPLLAAVRGPLLLTEGDRLDPAVADHLARSAATTAHLFGGPGALSPAVEQAVRDLLTR